MNKDFNKMTKQMGVSMMLQNKFCTEYTMNHYSAEELEKMWLVPNTKIMVPRYELMRFFRVVPDQATGKTTEEIIRVYVVNSSTEKNLLHCEIEYIYNTEFDLRSSMFTLSNRPIPMYILPPVMLDAIRAIVLVDMDKHVQNLYISRKIDEIKYEQDMHNIGTLPTNFFAFIYNSDEDHY